MRQPIDTDDDFYFDVQETSSVLGYSPRMVYGWGNAKQIDTKRVKMDGHSKVFFSLSSTLEYARQNSIRPNQRAARNITTDEKVLSYFEKLEEQIEHPRTDSQTYANKQQPMQSIQIERDERDQERIEELKGEVVDLRGKVETLNERLLVKTEETATKEALFGHYRQMMIALREASNRDIERVRQGKLKASEIALIPEITMDGELVGEQGGTITVEPKKGFFKRLFA